MSEHLQKAIEELEAKLREQLAAVAKTKSGINQLAELAGIEVPYPDVEEKVSSRVVRGDQFYGKSLQTSMREYLEMRGKPGGPVGVSEMHAALVKGGHQFDTKDDMNAKRVMRITLSKNSTVFHKLPNGQWGLFSWYPNLKPPKAKAGKHEPSAIDNLLGEEPHPDEGLDDEEGGEADE